MWKIGFIQPTLHCLVKLSCYSSMHPKTKSWILHLILFIDEELKIEAEGILELVVNKTEKKPEIAVGDVCNVYQSLSFWSNKRASSLPGENAITSNVVLDVSATWGKRLLCYKIVWVRAVQFGVEGNVIKKFMYVFRWSEKLFHFQQANKITCKENTKKCCKQTNKEFPSRRQYQCTHAVRN